MKVKLLINVINNLYQAKLQVIITKKINQKKIHLNELKLNFIIIIIIYFKNETRFKRYLELVNGALKLR